ncbi:MAG: thioredoxin domain-containing protein [Solirubrobacterales bacterium]
MATGPQQKRKELREKRLKAEAAAKGGDRRQNLFKIVGISAFVAIIAIVVIVVAVGSGGDDDSSSTSNASSSEVNQVIDSLPQNGTVLGNAKTGVTLVEFGDLQCPICKVYADDVLPDIITGPIKDGDANFDFRQWAILGEQSTLAAKAALAAAEQGRYWQFVEAFYVDQGIENSGYVTDDFLTGIAEDAGVPDIDQWNTDRESDALNEKLLEVDDEASAEGFSGTPSFAIMDEDGNLTTVSAVSADPAQNVQTIKDAIAKAQGQK